MSLDWGRIPPGALSISKIESAPKSNMKHYQLNKATTLVYEGGVDSCPCRPIISTSMYLVDQLAGTATAP